MLRLRVLGTLALERDCEPLAGVADQRKRLAILAVVALAGDQAVSRDRLQALFWAESDAERARKALNTALYSLRRDLGADVTSGNTQLRLNAAVVESDVAQFEDARRRGDLEMAIACYRGPLLDGIFIKDAPELEEWFEHRRRRLAGEHTSVLEQLAQRAESGGMMSDAIRWRRELVAKSPLSSQAALALMRALATNGDVAAALDCARTHATLCKRELEAPVAPEIDEFVRMLRTQPAPRDRTARGLTLKVL